MGLWAYQSDSNDVSFDEESSSSSTSEDEDETEKSSSEEESSKENKKSTPNTKKSWSESEDDTVNSSSSEEESSTKSEEEEKLEITKDKDLKQPVTKSSKPDTKQTKSNLDLLLDLDNVLTITPVMTPSLGGFLSPTVSFESSNKQQSAIQVVPAVYFPMKNYELLDRINGKGLSISYRFTRSPHLFSPSMLNIGLTFSNSTSENITDIKMDNKKINSRIKVHEFACISSLSPSCNLHGTLGVDFGSSTEGVTFEISSSVGTMTMTIKPPIGELMQPVTMSDETFQTKQNTLRGMYEHSATVSFPDITSVSQKVFESFNVASIPSIDPNLLRFAGQVLGSTTLVLFSITKKDNAMIIVKVFHEDVIQGEIVLNNLKLALKL